MIHFKTNSKTGFLMSSTQKSVISPCLGTLRYELFAKNGAIFKRNTCLELSHFYYTSCSYQCVVPSCCVAWCKRTSAVMFSLCRWEIWRDGGNSLWYMAGLQSWIFLGFFNASLFAKVSLSAEKWHSYEKHNLVGMYRKNEMQSTPHPPC